MLILLIKTVGWLLAHSPEWLVRGCATLLGDFMFFVHRSRRRIVLSNLDHAFPERTRAWRLRMGRESCRRLFETSLLTLATPFLSEARLRQIVVPSPGLLEALALQKESPRPTLICSPHLAYWEAQTSMGVFLPAGMLPEFGTIYRPLDSPQADDWARRSRERFGLKLLSRSHGFGEGMRILRRNGFLGILFDQNAGMQGALTLLFGRVCSTTELPGLMAVKCGARVYGIFPMRRAFWRVEIGLQRIESEPTVEGVTFALNRWLESALSGDDNLCASWLWVHDRWRHQDIPALRLRLLSSRNRLDADLKSRGLAELPRRTRIWVRIPNWLGDVVMALPALRALRASRPDAELTLVAGKQFLPLLKEWGVADHLVPLPPRGGLGYFAYFWRLRDRFPDVYLLFTQSVRGDIEAFLTGSRQRFGIVRPGRKRPLLTHAYHVPADFDEAAHHQLELWETFLQKFGLNAPFDRQPAKPPGARDSGAVTRAPIGLIPGSENNPAKRWPVAHWRALIDSLPERRFLVFGTARDLPTTEAICAGHADARVENLAGRTDIQEFATRLRECSVLVTNDTGGMHLANALGIPLVALFGPTNPIRTGPVFAAPFQLLQPPGCPAAGPGELSSLAPATVVASIT